MTSPRVDMGHHQRIGPPMDVVAWRARRLLEAGFSRSQADELSRSTVDIHAVLQLVDAGCPPHLAARILAPIPGED